MLNIPHLITVRSLKQLFFKIVTFQEGLILGESKFEEQVTISDSQADHIHIEEIFSKLNLVTAGPASGQSNQLCFFFNRYSKAPPLPQTQQVSTAWPDLNPTHISQKS